MHNTTSFSPIIQLPMQLDKIKRLNNFVVICINKPWMLQTCGSVFV